MSDHELSLKINAGEIWPKVFLHNYYLGFVILDIALQCTR